MQIVESVKRALQLGLILHRAAEADRALAAGLHLEPEERSANHRPRIPCDDDLITKGHGAVPLRRGAFRCGVGGHGQA